MVPDWDYSQAAHLPNEGGRRGRTNASAPDTPTVRSCGSGGTRRGRVSQGVSISLTTRASRDCAWRPRVVGHPCMRAAAAFRMDPSDTDRRVDDELLRHRRPSSTADRTSASESEPLPRVRTCMRVWSSLRSATAWRTTLSRRPVAGTILATGLSCRVTTTSSPRATRSRSFPKRFFASNAVTVIIDLKISW